MLDDRPALGSHCQKVQEAGVWKFVSLARQGTRYLWDSRPGSYYLDWWEGRRRREYAGETPSAALQAQRRKQHELAGALLMQDLSVPQNSRSESQPFVAERIMPEEKCPQTPIHEARNLFLAHVAAHSPDKPETHRRYRQVLEHFERHRVADALLKRSRGPIWTSTNSCDVRSRASGTNASLQPAR